MTQEEEDLQNDDLIFELGLMQFKTWDERSFSQNPRLVLNNYRQYASAVLRGIPPKQGIHLRFELIQSDELIGKAFKSKRSDPEFRFATVSTGAILYFHDFFAYLMSRSDILPRIGIVTLEKNLPYQFQPESRHPGFDPLLKKRLLRRDVNPKHPLRAEFANIMADAASKFLILHEIAHCAYGHVARSSVAFDERDKTAQEPLEIVKLRHTLEMDADSYAASQLLRPAIAEQDSGSDFTWNANTPVLPLRKLLYPTLLGITLMFRLFADPLRIIANGEDLLRRTHPLVMVRNHFCRAIATQLELTRPSGKSPELISKLCFATSIDASQIWTKITGVTEPSRMIMFDETSVDNGMSRIGAYLDELSECWHKIRPSLEPHTLLRLASTKYDM